MMFYSFSSLSALLYLFTQFLSIALALTPPAKSTDTLSIDASDSLALQTLSLTNLTFPNLPTTANLTYPKPQIICRKIALPSRRPLSVAGCAEILCTFSPSFY